MEGNEIQIPVTVKNIGKIYAGKEVVQVYYSAAGGVMEKPYQELLCQRLFFLPDNWRLLFSFLPILQHPDESHSVRHPVQTNFLPLMFVYLHRLL